MTQTMEPRAARKTRLGWALVLLLAVVLAVTVGLAIRAGDDRGADEGSYELGGETYQIDCEDRDLFMGQWMGPGVLSADAVFEAWSSTCGWTGSGPWLTESP